IREDEKVTRALEGAREPGGVRLNRLDRASRPTVTLLQERSKIFGRFGQSDHLGAIHDAPSAHEQSNGEIAILREGIGTITSYLGDHRLAKEAHGPWDDIDRSQKRLRGLEKVQSGDIFKLLK